MRHYSRTYYRYLWSYLAMLLVGVLALIVFFEAYFVNRFRSSIEETQQAVLKQSAQEIDNYLHQLQAIDYQITCANDNFLSYYIMEDSPVRDMKIVQEMDRMLAPLSFVSEAALLSVDTGYVYTSTGAYAADLFFSAIYHYEDWENPRLDLASVARRITRGAESVNGRERYVTMIYPPSVFSRLDKAVMLFLIREDRLAQALHMDSGIRQESVILDETDRILLSTLPLDSGEMLLEAASVVIDGTRYCILREPSQVSDWQYISLLNEQDMLQPISGARVVVGVLLMIMLAMGVTLIMVFMRVNYKPISELTRALGASSKGDELESLRDAIGSLAAQNEHMRAQSISTPDGQSLKDALLFSLLKGKFASFDDFNREAAPLGMVFDKPRYQVLMFKQFSGKEAVAFPREELTEAIDEIFTDGFSCHFRELFETTMTVCLVGMDEGAEERLPECCVRLIHELNDRRGLVFTIGASRCYDAIEHITTASFEASQAVREYFVCGMQQFIRYEQLRQSLMADHPLTVLDGLKNETPKQRADSVRTLIATLRENRVPSLLAKSYCNYAVQRLLEVNPAHVSVSDLFSVSYLSTIDSYEALMLELAWDAASDSVPEAGDSAGELLERIKSAVNARYDDCNFSIQDAAEQMNLTGAYLSKFFHQQTGETLSAYVAGLRMEKARRLLESTTMPLQMVAESVGYYNLNSFIRRFKQMIGTTPGEYRRAHQ